MQLIKKENQIKKAQQIALKAVDVFKSTMLELKKSNDILHEVIYQEEEQIRAHQENIKIAGTSIISNDYVIGKLSDFVPEE